MSTREHLLSQLQLSHLQIEADVARGVSANKVSELLFGLVRDLKDPEVFEFAWKGAGIHLDEAGKAVLPKIETWELEEAKQCPLPHESIWLETDVVGKGGRVEQHCWLINRDPASLMAFAAFPMIVRDGTLVYSGRAVGRGRLAARGKGDELESIVLNYLPANGEAGNAEYHAHIDLLLRFFRLLALPEVVPQILSPCPRLNRKRVKGGQFPLAVRRTITIDQRIERSAFRPRLTGAFSSRAEHARRAHVRRLRSGRLINVRNCVVNPGSGRPKPQNFIVKR